MADVIKYRFQCRRGLAASWVSKNEILLKSEIGLESDTGLGKVGDGVTAWNDLLYTIVGQVDLDGLADGKCLAWDSASSTWKVANRGAVYVPGTGIAIDSSNPESPIISSTLGSLSLSGNPDNYASLPSGLTSGDAGKAYLLKSDGLVYIWSGTAFPADGDGIVLGALAPYSGDLTSVLSGNVAFPTSAGKYFEIQDGSTTWLVPGFQKYVLPNPGSDDFSTNVLPSYTIGGDTVATYSISSGKLTITGGAQSTLLKKGLSFADGSLVSVITASSDGGFVFRVADNSNYYVCTIADSAAPSTPQSIKFYKKVAGVYTQLGSTVAVSFVTGTSHTYELDVVGNNISIKWDGVTVFTITDSTFTAAGYAGLRSNNGTQVIDSFSWSV